jgi:copper homeostasis protein
VTFHRAFDMTRDPHEALETLIALGVDRVLTKGQEDSIWEGLELVADLVRRAGDRIIVMPGGGRERNVKTIVGRTGAREIHVVGTRSVESQMQYRNPRCFMGATLRPAEFAWNQTDPDRVRAIVEALK